MINWLKSHLVDDAHKAWKWLSVQMMTAIAAIGLAWPLMPEDLKAYLPADLLPYISALAFLAIVLRLIKQGPKE
jgi:hypothetical protein